MLASAGEVVSTIVIDDIDQRLSYQEEQRSVRYMPYSPIEHHGGQAYQFSPTVTKVNEIVVNSWMTTTFKELSVFLACEKR